MAKVAQLPELQKPTPITEIVTSWERRGRQEGLQIGKEQGLQIGKEQGLQIGKEQGFYLAQKSIVMRIAKHKFGELNAETMSQIDALSKPQLEALLDSLIDMTDVTQLKTYLTRSKSPIEQIQLV